MALGAASIRVGQTVYRRVRDGNVNWEQGKIVRIERYKYAFRLFTVKWESGLEEQVLPKDLRLSKPGTTSNEKNKYKQ